MVWSFSFLGKMTEETALILSATSYTFECKKEHYHYTDLTVYRDRPGIYSQIPCIQRVKIEAYLKTEDLLKSPN